MAYQLCKWRDYITFPWPQCSQYKCNKCYKLYLDSSRSDFLNKCYLKAILFENSLQRYNHSSCGDEDRLSRRREVPEYVCQGFSRLHYIRQDDFSCEWSSVFHGLGSKVGQNGILAVDAIQPDASSFLLPQHIHHNGLSDKINPSFFKYMFQGLY